MTCDVRLQLAEVRCEVASCDACAKPILVVICNLRAHGAFDACKVRYRTLFWQ